MIGWVKRTLTGFLVKYLTQSTWSHAVIYVGHAQELDNLPDGTPASVEASFKIGLIAEAFQSVSYPILPRIEPMTEKQYDKCSARVLEILHIRHRGLFAPRVFDVSPYFQIIELTIQHGFDRRRLDWGE